MPPVGGSGLRKNTVDIQVGFELVVLKATILKTKKALDEVWIAWHGWMRDAANADLCCVRLIQWQLSVPSWSRLSCVACPSTFEQRQ
eukprot:3969728-Amphidinium_carterae.1